VHAGGLALRKGAWKYIPPQGSRSGELYNLEEDPGETKNLASERREIASDLGALLEKIRAAGRSRP
jgi:arylsulfatase